MPLEESFRFRLAAIYNTLNSYLFPKRDQIHSQMQQVEYRIQEMNRSKMQYERDLKAEFSAMNERLNAICGSKVAIL